MGPRLALVGPLLVSAGLLLVLACPLGVVLLFLRWALFPLLCLRGALFLLPVGVPVLTSRCLLPLFVPRCPLRLCCRPVLLLWLLLSPAGPLLLAALAVACAVVPLGCLCLHFFLLLLVLLLLSVPRLLSHLSLRSCLALVALLPVTLVAAVLHQLAALRVFHLSRLSPLFLALPLELLFRVVFLRLLALVALVLLGPFVVAVFAAGN